MPRKLCLVVVDSLRGDMLRRAVAAGEAPSFGAVLDRGALIGDCASSFPSVTPVASAEIVTGRRADRHGIPGMNWYHRVERRYVEYGSSFEATRAMGVLRTIRDVVFNLNMAHLSHEVETVFETLADAGLHTACTPFLVFRGRTRHELGLEGLARRLALAANVRHAVWGPEELFYGELYTSRSVDARPTLARPGNRDAHSAAAARGLVEGDHCDCLLLSLPDTDKWTHERGPAAQEPAIARADRCLAEVAEGAGGIESFLDEYAVILLGDHSQSPVEREVPLAEQLGERWRVQRPSDPAPGRAELAVSPSARAAAVYVLREDGREAMRREVIEVLEGTDGVDLVAWLAGLAERPAGGSGPPGGPRGGDLWAVVRGHGSELRFRPGGAVRDRRGARWEVDGDPGALAGHLDGDVLRAPAYPDALGRLWGALRAPHAGEILVSLEPGYECVDWGGDAHLGGGSHGSLHAEDSHVPLVLCGLEPGIEALREQWTIADVAGLVAAHFGLPAGEPRLRRSRGRHTVPAGG